MPPQTQQNPDDAKFQSILQAHGYTPPTQQSGGTSGSWRDLAKQASTQNTQQLTTPSSPNLGQLTADQYQQAAKKITSSITQGADKFAAQPDAKTFGDELHRTGILLEAGLGAASGMSQAVWAPITASLQKIGQMTGADPMQAIMQTPVGKMWSSFAEKHPEAATNITDALNVAGTATADLGATNPLNAEIGKTTGAVKESVEGAIADMNKPAPPQPTIADVQNEVQNHFTTAQQILDNTPNAPIKDVIADTHRNIVDGLKADNMPNSSAKVATLKPSDYSSLTEYQQAVKDAIKPENPQVQSVAKEWQKPADINKPSFNKARQVLAKDPKIPQFLAEQGIVPGSLVEDGQFSTADSAEALRDTAGKMSADTLRPSLKVADYSTPKTSVQDAVDLAIKNAQKDPTITPGDMKSVISSIKSEGEALGEKHPNGMGLVDMHDSKITYAQNSGYSPIKDPATNIRATANRSLSSALGDLVESKAPQGVPVKEFNSYLSKYYKAADYLDTLHGKTAPATPAQLIARGVARYGGAAIGGHFGGGVVSEFAGYQIGKAVEHALENLTNPARAHFLRNLETTNPEAFTQVEQYLKNANSAGGKLLLPEGSAMITPAPSEAAQQEGRAINLLGPK